MVNSGVRGTEQDERRSTSGLRSVVSNIYCNLSYIQVPSAGKPYDTTGTPRDFVASGSSLVVPRAAADTRGQHSTLHYTGASIVRYAIQGPQGAGEEERRRDEGTGEVAKEVARAAGSEAAGAWVIGG
jgi:hypothetical protein